MKIMSISAIMTIITIFRIVVCFQCWHKCTVKRFGPGVGLWCGWEKKQNPCIPNWIWRHHKGSMVETRRPYHDEVQAVTAIKRLHRKRVAVNSLHTIVLDVTKHQTVVQWEMALALRWICEVQYLKQIIYLHNNYNNYNNPNNSNLKKMKCSHKFLVQVYCCQRNSNTGQHHNLCRASPLDQRQYVGCLKMPQCTCTSRCPQLNCNNYI